MALNLKRMASAVFFYLHISYSAGTTAGFGSFLAFVNGSLSVRNTSLPVQITDGGIVSSKSDGLEHGYGLQNIRYILSLYDAIPVIEYTDGWFQFACEFRNMPIS